MYLLSYTVPFFGVCILSSILSLMKGRGYLILLLKLSSWQHYMLKFIKLTWQVTFIHVSDLWLIFVLWSVLVKLFLAVSHEFLHTTLLASLHPPVFKCCVFSFLPNKPFIFSTNHTFHFLRMLFIFPGQGRNIHCNSVQYMLTEWINDCTLKLSVEKCHKPIEVKLGFTHTFEFGRSDLTVSYRNCLVIVEKAFLSIYLPLRADRWNHSGWGAACSGLEPADALGA